MIIAVLLLLPSPPEDTAVEPAPTHVPVFSFSPKIPKGVTIAGVDVGGLTEEKAIALLEYTLPSQHKIKKMVVIYGPQQVALSSETTQAFESLMVHHMARWSSGLRLRPLTPTTGVRIPLGSPYAVLITTRIHLFPFRTQ